MDSRREAGEYHTARVVLLQVAKGKAVVDRWLFDTVSRHQRLLEEGIVSWEEFARLAKVHGFTLLPPPSDPVVGPPRVNLRGTLPPLSAGQVPNRIFAVAERFLHDFGLSEDERDDMIRALRRDFPGEYPRQKELLRFFWNHLLPSD